MIEQTDKGWIGKVIDPVLDLKLKTWALKDIQDVKDQLEKIEELMEDERNRDTI